MSMRTRIFSFLLLLLLPLFFAGGSFAQDLVTTDPPYHGPCTVSLYDHPGPIRFNTTNRKLWACGGNPLTWDTIPPQSNTGLLTGAHFAVSSDYTTFKSIGFDFALTVLSAGDTAGLQSALSAAAANNIKLIIGQWPPPFTLNADNATWTIAPSEIAFLQSLAANPANVLAVYVFNEPYWTDTTNTNTNACGMYSAAQLRQLRSEIQSVWPAAKIYQDIGNPSAWVQGGSVWTPCAGTKYADQTNVADYVGIWYYPFSSTATGGYNRAQALSFASTVGAFVKSSMAPATPVFLAQSFAGSSGTAGDGGAAVMPTATQLLDLNCSLRPLLPAGSLISWYVWNFSTYSNDLKNAPALWSSAPTAACH